MSTDDELDAMTDGQAAEYYYRHRDEIEHEPGELVELEPARPLSLVVSVRLRADEAEQVGATGALILGSRPHHDALNLMHENHGLAG